uniref:Uncharacterized protein n=1 Tax=Acrobeloides nanus TaxID=290746 RepID=A0A914EPL3_9BILA
MVTARSWSSITDGVDKTKSSPEERQEMQQQAVSLVNQISQILDTIPKEMILVLKTNDLLRSIEHRLGTENRSDGFLEEMLLQSSDVPQILRRNYISSGYRPLNRSIHYYLLSAFRLHNELVNVWSHGLPLFILLLYYIYPEVKESQRIQLLVLYFGIGCLLAASALTHLLHSRSPCDHIFWLIIDFSGIAIFSFCTGLQRHVCQGSSTKFSVYYLATLTLVVGLQYLTTCLLYIHRPFWKKRHLIRFLTCTLSTIWINIPLFERYFDQNSDDLGIHYHIRAVQWLILSSIFMGASFPECMAKGVFDFFCYGHQLFHLCILAVIWNIIQGAQYDCLEREFSTEQNQLILHSLIGMLIFVFVTVIFLRQDAAKKYEKVVMM